MKLNEIKPIAIHSSIEQLDEFSLKSLAAAGVLGLGLASTPSVVSHPESSAPYQPSQTQAVTKDNQLLHYITARYGVSQELASKVIRSATKYADNVFPSKLDLLAVVGIESSYNPRAVSQLRHDPAVGLTQIRPKVWGTTAPALNTVDAQLKMTNYILTKYYAKFKTRDAAIHAYNVGETNFRHQRGLNPGYVTKFNKELGNIKKVTQYGAPLSVATGKKSAIMM